MYKHPMFQDDYEVDFDLVQDIILQFKLPRGATNHGLAQDTVCRMCGSRGPFEVTAVSQLLLASDGAISSALQANPGWFMRSITKCTKCGFESCMDEFFVPGLDEVLAKSGHVELDTEENE